MTATVDISGFNRGMTGFVDRLGIEGPVVLKKEMGELLKTLIKITPPKDPAKTRGSIGNSISTKFAAAGDSDLSEHGGGGKVGKSGILWYRTDSDFLRGVAPENDMRKASVEELRPLLYRLRKSGRQILPFRHPRDQQRVMILQTVLTRRSTVNKLIAQIKGHVGRLKAGWLASWDRLSPGGGNQPPQWVTRHKAGARGYFVDGLGVKGFPSFTIANTAVGVGNPRNNLTWLVQGALNIRAKAMRANLALFMKGKKHLGDYARA